MILDLIKRLFNKPQKSKSIPQRPLTDDEFNDRRAAKEKKMNQILEKISKGGFDSLSQHEKNFLENYGKN